MSKIDDLKRQLDVIGKEIEELAVFRNTPAVRKFRRQLEGEKSVILAKIANLTETEEEVEKTRLERLTLSNKNRSEKMKRTWRYLKAIKENYPIDISLRELRTALKRHRQGLETDISDVAWKNPSP